ncbi:MAG: fasciclin domain-containing protein [Cyanobacteria bacterium P01_A01_bin.17]
MNSTKVRIASLNLLVCTSLFGIGLARPAFAESAMNSSVITSTLPQKLAQATGDIVDVAAGNPDFSTLVQAVQAAELVDALKSEGPLTVFAPTNAAFAALPEGALDALLLPENRDLLTQVLQYHVVSGEVASSDLETGSVTTLNGDLAVEVSPEGVAVNDASVVQADVDASNGVVHAIDGVLIPEGVVAELQSRAASDDTEADVSTEEEDVSTEEPAPPVRGLW